jgi:hypothetical protein
LNDCASPNIAFPHDFSENDLNLSNPATSSSDLHQLPPFSAVSPTTSKPFQYAAPVNPKPHAVCVERMIPHSSGYKGGELFGVSISARHFRRELARL